LGKTVGEIAECLGKSASALHHLKSTRQDVRAAYYEGRRAFEQSEEDRRIEAMVGHLSRFDGAHFYDLMRAAEIDEDETAETLRVLLLERGHVWAERDQDEEFRYRLTRPGRDLANQLNGEGTSDALRSYRTKPEGSAARAGQFQLA
jgi:hypothetical protein